MRVLLSIYTYSYRIQKSYFKNIIYYTIKSKLIDKYTHGGTPYNI